MSDDERDFYKSIQYALVVPALERLKEQRALSETAERLGIQKQRLTELKSGNRELTFYYLSILISGGIVDITDILQKRPLETLSKEQRTIVLRLIADPEILELLYQAKIDGLPVKELIKIALKKS